MGLASENEDASVCTQKMKLFVLLYLDFCWSCKLVTPPKHYGGLSYTRELIETQELRETNAGDRTSLAGLLVDR